MEDMEGEGFEIDKEDFTQVLNKFKSKSTHSYDFLLKSGKRYQEAMFHFCKKMIEKEVFPNSFRRTILYMIWKQKGQAEILKTNRFIHLKESFLPRTCEALVVGKMKNCILQSSSKYQVGGQPGHGAEEHIFTIKSVWNRLEKRDMGMIITLVDIVAFFDREDIYDAMQTLHDIGVNPKAARLWYKLNEGTEISVKTASGMTERKVVGDVIGQGTSGAALVSQVNLDRGLMEYFGGSQDEISYGSVRLQPLAYQDDIMKGSKDVMGAQVGHIRLNAMLQDKGLEAHPDKTCVIVCGSKKYKKKVEQDLAAHPLQFGQFKIKHRESDRYLGQVLHTGGLEKSAEATVRERAGRIKGAALEIKSIIEDFQMQCIGGMRAAWVLWERALVPKLLSGAGTWFGGECKEAIDVCDGVQNFFWRVMLGVPESCPKIALRCETRMIGMQWRIWQEKILLLQRIKKQDEATLSRQVYEEGKIMGWPGLGSEVADICQKIGIPNINDSFVSKKEVKEALFNHHYSDMKKELEKSKKLKDIQNEDFTEIQPYFNEKSVESTRMAFKVRCMMVPEIPNNFKDKYKKKENGLICSYCDEGQVMSQSHCLVCPAWAEQREGLDLTSIVDMATFFRKLLTERARLEALDV